MARIASFTSAGVPTGEAPDMTLDALMARQKALADAAGNISANRNMQSPWQGAAYVGEKLANAIQQRRVQGQMADARHALAQIIGGIDPTAGPSQDQLGQAFQIDPDLGLKLMAQAIQARRDAAQLAQHNAERSQDREWQVSDTTAAAQRAEEARKEQEAFQSGQADKSQTFQAAQQERSQTFAERQAEAARAEAERVRLANQDTYGDVITGPEAEAQGLDPSGHYQKSSKTGKYQPISTSNGVNINLPSSEVMGRLGVSQNFLDNFDTIRQQAANGDLTGPVDYVTGTLFGRGPAGIANRTIASGVDGLRRMLTGAGMPASEAADYLSRYSTSMTDDAETLTNKLDNLKADLLNTRQSILAGHVPPAMSKNPALQVDPAANKPAAPAAELPPGVTEEDITATMQANKMTRQQVLDALKARSTNGGP